MGGSIAPEYGGDRWRVPRNAGDGVPYGGVCAGSPGCGGDRVGCAAERSMTVPYIGIVLIRRSAVGIGWGVPRNAGDGVPYGRISYAERKLANSREGPMALFDHRPNRTNCQPALPGRRAGASEQSREPNGAIGHRPNRTNCHPALPGRRAGASEQSSEPKCNDPTHNGTTTTAPITVWVCILCRKTVQPELHR